MLGSSVTAKRWRKANLIPDSVLHLLRDYHPVMAQVLYNRGQDTAERARMFLQGGDDALHNPFHMHGMPQAVQRIRQAIRKGELIAIYGDFDADGVTSTALLTQTIEGLGGRVMPYIPNRVDEGYGLNTEALRLLRDRGVRLVVTVDCGIRSVDEVRDGVALGLDMIVTDHHSIGEELPPALAVIDPKIDAKLRLEEGRTNVYPEDMLAGVGVAYKLAEALYARVWNLQEARARLEPKLDLVALGTVGDLSPLLGENRLMVKLGLQQINRGGRLGLRALSSVAGYGGRTVDVDTISYVLAPRLNAAGRMGDARLSLELLTCNSESDAARLAGELETANRQRQAATAAALNAAREELLLPGELPPAIVLAGDYPSGVVGLVASRLADEFRRPAFVIELGQEECRGSGRGVHGFDVVQALADASDLLVRYGGHSQAAGFAFAPAHLDALRTRLEMAAGQSMAAAAEPELYLEGCLRARDLGPALYDALALLEPCGAGNSRPLFYSRRMQVRDARIVGAGHLRLWLGDETGTVGAIGFGMGTEEYAFAQPGTLVDCAYTVGRNERGGTIGFEMVLKDLRPSGLACILQ